MTVHSPSEKPSEGDTDSDTEQRIWERAYLLSEAERRQDGGVDEYWHRARELIEAVPHCLPAAAVPWPPDLRSSR